MSLRPAYAAAVAVLLACGAYWGITTWILHSTRDAPVFAFTEPVERDVPDLGFARLRQPLPATGRLRALVVFSRFQDDPDAPVPDWAEDIFDAAHPGSLTHFYQVMSFGQLTIEGSVLPRRYASSFGRAAYLAPSADERGKFPLYVEHILRQVDRDVDLAQYDSDGPDAVPSSRDDDGIVDYVFVVLQSTPRNFILGGATGISGLQLVPDYRSHDLDSFGAPVLVSGQRRRGALVGEGGGASLTLATMCHEFGHSLGLTDLYDLHRPTPEEDSAGIGAWGLMGLGTQGWSGSDGPNPICTGNLDYLGWVGTENSQLLTVDRDVDDLRVRDLYLGGHVVKVPLGATLIAQEGGDVYETEYLLLENRTRHSQHYNRKQPADGLLVWHIRPHAFLLAPGEHGNSREDRKLMDLVCADGLYTDAGYPVGREPQAQRGRDNLDYYSLLDPSYARRTAGNAGDATDPFDGVRFTRLASETNPSSNFDGRYVGAAVAPSLEHIRRDGDDILLDVRVPRWSGTIEGDVTWVGPVYVDGDVTVAPGARLSLHESAVVTLAATDGQAAGMDPRRVEIRVLGELRVDSRRIYYYTRKGQREHLRSSGPEFIPDDDELGWGGIVAHDGGVVDGRLSEFMGRGDGRHQPSPVATAVVDAVGALPEKSALRGNYPNPFNGETTIEFSLSSAGLTQLEVYNAIGQVVRTLVDGELPAGHHSVRWDGRDEFGRPLGTGTYLYRFRSGSFAAGGRMALLR